MSPDVKFDQFSVDDLNKIAQSGERTAGYKPYQQSSIVLLWRSRSAQFADFLADP